MSCHCAYISTVSNSLFVILFSYKAVIMGSWFSSRRGNSSADAAAKYKLEPGEGTSNTDGNVQKRKIPTQKIKDLKIDYQAVQWKLTNVPLNDETFSQALDRHQNPYHVVSLVLNQGHISKLPANIGRYRGLLTLNLSDNYLEEIPWSIVYLKNLQNLDLSQNLLCELPRVIGHLPNLLTLDLSSNYLTSLPTDLLNLPKLEVLIVQKNPHMKSPSTSICEQGKAAIFVELKKRQLRKNLWEGMTPFVDYVMPKTGPKSLFQLSVDCIMDCKVNYIQPEFVPPMIQKHLEFYHQEGHGKIQLAKCSDCRKYFSSATNFDNHTCRG